LRPLDLEDDPEDFEEDDLDPPEDDPPDREDREELLDEPLDRLEL
jgi:hypothetical protein